VSAQAWFAQQEIPVVPGQSATIQMTIANLGDSTETFSVIPSGLAAGWTTIRPATVTMFGGSRETVNIEVNPPPVPSTTAGPTALTVRVVPQSNPDDVASTETTLKVAVHNDRRLSLLQPALRSRRKATYELMFDNQSNAQASCRMRLSEGMTRVEADFDPPAVGVEPGAATLVKLKLRARSPQWERRSRTIPFVIEAEQPGVESAFVAGTLIQAPMLPERLFSRVAWAAVALGALAAAWFGVIRPEIRDTVRTQVDSAIATIPTAVPQSTLPGATPSTTAPTGTGGDEEVPGVFSRLAPATGAGQTTSADYAVAADADLLLTDVILQNPSGDTGTATLLIGADTVYQWDLARVQLDAFLPTVTAIKVPAGSTLSFLLACGEAGNGQGTCSAAMTVVGELRPVGG
jgi:hypothetical protein